MRKRRVPIFPVGRRGVSRFRRDFFQSFRNVAAVGKNFRRAAAALPFLPSASIAPILANVRSKSLRENRRRRLASRRRRRERRSLLELNVSIEELRLVVRRRVNIRDAPVDAPPSTLEEKRADKRK